MTTPLKLAAGSSFPDLSWAQTDGGRLEPARMDGWRMLVIYRGAHCPLCKTYMKTLQRLKEEFEDAGVAVLALSSDPQERARKQLAEEGWTFPVGFDLNRSDMLQLGLYISEPRSAQETDREFAEPGLFVINAEGAVQIVDTSNAPFARPDLKSLLDGLKFIRSRDYPIRGTA